MEQPTVKKHLPWALFLLAALALSFYLCAQTASAGSNGIDEDLVRQAMRHEAFRLLALKIAGDRNGAAAGFDYHIEQAYEKIRNRLPSDPLSGAELEVWLRPQLQNPPAGGHEGEFRTLIENFILGMSLEIITTLEYECEQAEDLIAQVDKLVDELQKLPRADRDALERAARQLDLDRKLPGVVKDVERRWRIPAAAAESFSVFNAWKKNMTGRNADRDLRLVFDLGDRYADRYPFLERFMENYRCLAEAFRLAVRRLDAVLAGSGAEF